MSRGKPSISPKQTCCDSIQGNAKWKPEPNYILGFERISIQDKWMIYQKLGTNR